MLGSVYFIQEGTDGPIKIGFTEADVGVRARCTYMQVGNSSPLRVLGEIRGVSKLAERRWHQKFAASHKLGEWFWPSKELLDAIADVVANPPRPRPELLVVIPAKNPREVIAEWMDANGVTPAILAEQIAYTESHVRYQLDKRRWRTAPAFAVAIEEATGGAVIAEEWLAWEAHERAAYEAKQGAEDAA